MLVKASLALFSLLPLLVSAGPVGPQTQYKLISSGRDGKCLSLAGGISDTPYDGAPIVSAECNIASAWDLDPSGSGSFVLSGTNYALDIGLDPTNNGALKVWTSYPGSPQQTWTLNVANQIVNGASGQCLDEGDNGIQTYQCFDGNRNQLFYLSNKPGSPSSYPTSSVSASATTSASASASPSSTPPSFEGVQIHPNGNPDLCVTVQNGYTAVGARVAVSSCFGGSEVSPFQAWVIPSGGRGPLRIKSGANDGSYLCLDAGDNPGNGSGLKTWTCYDGLLQQDWTFGRDSSISLTNGQCMDVEKESGPTQAKPYGSLKDLQTWECSYNGDTNMGRFTFSP